MCKQIFDSCFRFLAKLMSAVLDLRKFSMNLVKRKMQASNMKLDKRGLS